MYWERYWSLIDDGAIHGIGYGESYELHELISGNRFSSKGTISTSRLNWTSRHG